MARLGLFALVGISIVLSAASFLTNTAKSDTDRDAAVSNNLLVQTARVKAIKYLLDQQPEKAVHVLEAQLERSNASQEYLTLLRDAYRAYVKELIHTKQDALAQKYQARLDILEGTGESAPSTKPPASNPTSTASAPPTVQVKQTASPLQNVLAGRSGPRATSRDHSYLPGSLAGPTAPPPPTEPSAKTDPVALSQKAPAPLANSVAAPNQAQSLLEQAEAEFGQKHYADAWRLYEQAHKLDDKITDGCKDRWAYCKLHRVVEQLKQPEPPPGSSWNELVREVQGALVLAPLLDKTGQWLLGEIDRRQSPANPVIPAQAAPALEVAVKHHARSASGWSMAETTHFRIFHNQATELVDRIARVAEETHVAMYRKWFGKDGAEWTPKCDLFVHASAQDYSRATGVPTNSPGHSRFETDPSSGRVVKRRVDVRCDNPAMLQCVLPHETTHVVLAGEFGNQQVPRWVDEGIAVLTEPAEKVAQHHQNLARCFRDKELFALKELMQLPDYPQARRVSAFYAQSVSLVEFLSELCGPIVFCHFVRDSQREGYEAALRKHYRIQDFNDLQERWQQHAVAEINRATPDSSARK